jgi:Restriction endonuclease
LNNLPTAPKRQKLALSPRTRGSNFREPLTALHLRHGEAPTKPYDPTQAARVERAPLGLTEPISLLDSENNTFVVNIEHPFLKTVHEKVRGNKKAQEVIHALDLFAVAEKLFEGFLFDLGLTEDKIDRILAWRDGLLRAMALQYATAPADEVITEVWSTSFVGNKPFEKALQKLFERMGFAATHDGLSGHKDVLVVAPIGNEEYRFTVEAKGSRGRVRNDAAEIGGAIAHRDKVGARFAIIVAREFIGFQGGRDEEPAILQECRSAGGVTLVTVDTLVELLQATLTYHYPLEMLLPVLEEVEPPSAKMNRVGALRRPTANFDFRGVLEEVWRLQQGKAAGDMVPIRGLWQESEDRWGCELDDFQKRLIALGTLSGGLLRVHDREQAVILHQSPEIVADSISLAVELARKAEERR